VSLYPAHGADTDELLRRADISVSDAKAKKIDFAFYEPGSDEFHLQQIRLINDLRVAIDHDELEDELVEMVRDKIGAIACFRRALVVDRLPKTRSGKILRRVIRQIADGEEYSVPSTIDDPAILEEISEQFRH